MNIKKELTYYKNDLTQQELRDSVNDTIIPSIDELLSDYKYLPLGTLEDQVNESTNNTLMISETIDITNLTFSSDGQLQVNMPTNSNLVKNQNWLGNMNHNTEDLVNRMFEMNDE
ncbi:3514_t:CDS:1 [Cetraspora pellucida]|uniref:3514_t:CDS:1 n=1 Tax=Cetraspora pellucida TaxID=1433469 RepID=A0A9N8VKZ0_9GLOM|nr:3514_t:CDS:1 [Cetraspora pellucida]